MTNNLKKYVMSNSQNPAHEYHLGNITVYVKEALPPSIDLNRILDFVSSTLPSKFYQNVKMIYIGRFPFLMARDVDAIFQDGSIYLSSQQDNEHDLLSDLIHEISHSFEETNFDSIYGDGEIKQEFLAKRQKIYEILISRGYKVSEADFLNHEFSKDFDYLLNNEIGYSTLSTMTSGLFISPYGMTSLREYYANAFEEFFVNDMHSVKQLTPAVYKKLFNYLRF